MASPTTSTLPATMAEADAHSTTVTQSTLIPAVTGLHQDTAATATPITAATATATLPAEPSTPPPAERPTLLREWQQEQSSPPVAPAVVVAESDHRRSSSYSYPVATFVRDLVRTGMDQISLAASYPLRPSDHHSHNEDETLPLSVRSEADAEALEAAIRRASHPEQPQPTTVSARTINDYFGDDSLEPQEFILVDGDLIAVPPEEVTSPRQEQEEMIRDRLRQHDDHRRQSCQTPHPRRMRKGVRKISKFFRRVRRGSSKESAGDAASAGVGAPRDAASTVTEETVATEQHQQLQLQQREDETVSPSAAVATSTIPPAQSPKRRGLRRRRRSWKKDQNRQQLALSPSHSVEQADERDGSSEEISRSNSGPSVAMTGLETPSTTDDSLGRTVPPQYPHQYNHFHHHLDPLSPPIMPRMEPIQEADSGRTESVMAVFLGTNDQIQQPGFDTALLPADVAAVAFIEDSADMSYYKKDDGVIVPSVLPLDADYKVDKSDAPDVESMLMRAAHETTNDLDSSDLPTPSLRGSRGKSASADAVPLSQARHADIYDYKRHVYNDMLKVVMVADPCVDKSWVARSLRNSQKRPRKRATLGVDVHSWTPPGLKEHDTPIKCIIWDVQGATGSPADHANFGAHPGTQSLFFSGQSLYLLVWDLACNNPRTNLRPHFGQQDDSDDSDDDNCEEDDDRDEYADAFVREEENRKADRALLADISRRVLPWADTIALRGPKSAILPVAVVPPGMSEEEVKRRCNMMQNSLVEHVNRYDGEMGAPTLLSGADSKILCVDYKTGEGIDRLQETVQSIATDSSKSVFHHVGTVVPPGTVEVLDLIRRYKEQHKLILLDYLLGEIDNRMGVPEVLKALQFLSNIGEILYFTSNDDVLSRYIILSRKWLVSALSCILRNDLKRELSETRRFMNMQCIYSEHEFTENEVIKALVSGTMSSCPLLSGSDSQMLWQSMSFMREAADHYSQLSESSTSTPTMFYFLERLLVHAGIFLPLNIPEQSTLERSEVFFVPSLLAQADPGEVWTYKSSESWKATLCHSWLFRDGVPPNLMEHLTVKVLSDLYAFSREFQGDVHRGEIPSRTHTVPIRNTSLNEILEEHDKQPIGRVKIHQIVCWNSSLLVKVGTIFADQNNGELRESFAEIFVAIVDQSANHCVSSDAMRAGMQRVIVSGKGQVGYHGRKIWKGGYEVILKSVREGLSDFSNVDSQVVCPECLARSSPRSASTWSWDSIYALAQSGGSVVRCMRGHRVDSNLVCGTSAEKKQAPAMDSTPHLKGSKPVAEILPSVVLVGLWDTMTNEIRHVGSGFIIDRKLGLIATAGHILFNMDSGRTFGMPYFGLTDAKVVIGVIAGDGLTAKFRYFGDIIADDIHSVDACIVRIISRMEQDVDDEGAGCAHQPERVLTLDTILDENLRSLKLTNRFEIEENVRVLGFNQGGEGVYEKGKHINRSADFAKGYICRRFQAPIADDSSSSDSSSHMSFTPREEVVIMCPTISGHSGGPCVNDEGKVIGILSRADPVDRQRCYLVPATELKALMNTAKKHCTRTATLTSMASM